MTHTFENAERCAQAIVDTVGREIRLAIPVGIGKPNLLTNALYRLAVADPTIKLTIFTGLTLVRPRPAHELQRRLVEPLLDRLFESWPDLEYAEAMRSDTLPPNVEVHEFFLQAGAWMDSKTAQRSYVSLNYVEVARHLQRLNVNVLAQLLAPDPSGGDTLSLSSNTDVALDMRGYVAGQRKRNRPMALVGEINSNLPYMTGEALRPRADFDFLLVPETPHFDLFAPPKMPVSMADHAMALRAACLIKDGGTLQIGIGAFSDALSHALILRHNHNDAFRDLVGKLGGPAPRAPELAPFTEGLYACSELLTEGLLSLREAGIVKRRVAGPSGQPAAVHAAFFIGSPSFYERLRTLPDADRDDVAMTAVSFTNSILGHEQLRRSQRRHARFVNTAMIATLLGAAASDQLEDGRVVSGVGGQNDFIAIAHQLPGARSILVLKSTRRRRGRNSSNILWRFGHASVPRQLKDMIVTEYGVANLRGKSDRDTIVEMLRVADSEFQDRLTASAIKAGKLESSFALEELYRDNRPARIEGALKEARASGLLPRFPLGTELTAEEQKIAAALEWLRDEGTLGRIRALASGLGAAPLAGDARALERMRLKWPDTMKERLLRRVLVGAMRQAQAA